VVQNFLVRLVLGELRQGALEGLMIDAIAKAADAGADSATCTSVHAIRRPMDL
jgi:ATP-dependent DNA ligase